MGAGFVTGEGNRATDTTDRLASSEQTVGAARGGSPRIPGIDGLRAAAILIVMVSHAGLGWIVPGGFGVTVFFFLSGYLITTLLRLEWQRGGRVDLVAFYQRRALRILPPLYLTMALVVALIAARLVPGRPTAAGLAVDALFLTNYAAALGVAPALPIPLWSLDVEEHFYLAFPALFILLAPMRRGRPTLLLAALCGLVLLVRAFTAATPAASEIYYWSHTRIDSIIFGAILALWQNPVLDARAWRPRPWHVAAAAATLVLTLVLRDPTFRETLRYTLQGAALFVVFSAAIQARGPVARLLDSRLLRVVALLSYTLYLIHMPALALAERLLPKPWAIAVGYLLAFGWAQLLFVAVERPLARRRKRSLERALARRGAQPAAPRD